VKWSFSWPVLEARRRSEVAVHMMRQNFSWPAVEARGRGEVTCHLLHREDGGLFLQF
jgi:hypothetical protein